MPHFGHAASMVSKYMYYNHTTHAPMVLKSCLTSGEGSIWRGEKWVPMQIVGVAKIIESYDHMTMMMFHESQYYNILAILY